MPSPVSVPVTAEISRFFSCSRFFFAETVHGRLIRDSVPVGTGFYRPVFNPSYPEGIFVSSLFFFFLRLCLMGNLLVKGKKRKSSVHLSEPLDFNPMA